MKEAVAEVSAVDVDKAKSGKSKPRCKYCNGVGHGNIPDETTRKKRCKAFGQTCYRCQGSGHFSTVCPSKKEDAKSNAVAAVEERKESTAKFMSVKTGPDVRVNPAQARVSLIPLEDFSSVDTTDDNLAHMLRSKEARRPGTTIPG